ncbi:hypothetical protein P3T76_005189 [Phytophthora citrophthora]|uniref:Uncharacterized protein n=1 Tax=Phytophthora citrophthora TaxID=4793 RepID=A0AAD9LNE1_9STRA|nr:hypothetical protein P3T76_005189 [Phytophthora citrophthora]
MVSDEYEVHVLSGFVPIFWCFVGVGVVLFYYSLGYARKYSTTAAFLLPVSSFPYPEVNLHYCANAVYIL